MNYELNALLNIAGKKVTWKRSYNEYKELCLDAEKLHYDVISLKNELNADKTYVSHVSIKYTNRLSIELLKEFLTEEQLQRIGCVPINVGNVIGIDDLEIIVDDDLLKQLKLALISRKQDSNLSNQY